MPLPTPASVTATPSRRRFDSLDSLRGVALVLVVLSHGWQLWPTEWLDAHAAVRPFFRSGNFAVTVFFVAAGLLTYISLAARGLPRMRPGVALARRLLRVGPSLWLMLAFLLVVATFDSTDTTPSSVNLQSAAHVLTYSWNWYVQGHLIDSRPDFGHLWYLSVEMQAFVAMAVFLYFLRGRPVGVLYALGGLLALLTWWRFHVQDTEFVFQVLVRTTARMDPFVVGVLLGAALPLVRRYELPRRALQTTQLVTAAALVPLAWYCSVDERFLGWGVTMLEFDIALFFGAVVMTPAAVDPERRWTTRPLAFLGRNSLLIYIWHYPLFVLIGRHTPDWHWEARTALAVLLLAATFMIYDRLVERRVSAALSHPAWRHLEGGLLPGLRGFVGRSVPTPDKSGTGHPHQM